MTLENRSETLTARVRSLSSDIADRPALVYFDVIGICWPIRCLLHIKNVDYELIEIPLEAWGQTTPDGQRPLKACFRNGHLPLYVDRDVYLGQSTVILGYLGEKHGLIGDTKGKRLAAMEVTFSFSKLTSN